MYKRCCIIALLCGLWCPAAWSGHELEPGRTAALEITAALDNGRYAQAVDDIESAMQHVDEQLRAYEGRAIPAALIGDYVRLATLLSATSNRLLADKRTVMPPEERATLETTLAQDMEDAAARIQRCASSEFRSYARLEDAASLFTDAAVLLADSGRMDRAGQCIQTAVNLTEQMVSFEQTGGDLVIWQLDRRLFTREFLACFILHASDSPKALYERAESIIRKYASAEWICKTLLTLEHQLPGRRSDVDPLGRYQYLALLERCLRDNASDKTLPQLYYELGTLADLLGLAPDRIRWLRRILEIDPNSTYGSTAKQLLEATGDPVLEEYLSPPPFAAERGEPSSAAAFPVARGTSPLAGPADARGNPDPSQTGKNDSGETVADHRRIGTAILYASLCVVFLLMAATLRKGAKWRQAMHGRCS